MYLKLPSALELY